MEKETNQVVIVTLLLLAFLSLFLILSLKSAHKKLDKLIDNAGIKM